MLVESLAMAYSAVVPMLHNAAVTCSANARHKHGFLCVRWAKGAPCSNPGSTALVGGSGAASVKRTA